MKTKHTPGPWNSKPIIGKAAGLVFGTQPGRTYGRTIAHVTDCGGGKTESIANTRLIAAAPDMLAACEKALEAFGPSSNSVVLVLQNAINKAKI